MPNLSRLAEQGCFKELKTTCPAMSPVAWSTFLTGVNPAKHNIYDFLNRDFRTYMPVLSSSEVRPSTRTISIGKFKFTVGKPTITMLRKSQPFWKILGDHGIFSTILRVPITFPPEKFKGLMLSAMCVPDLRGSQGSFSYYTTERSDREMTGGYQYPLEPNGNSVEGELIGPENSAKNDGSELRVPFSITLNGAASAKLRVDSQTIDLKRREYSEWIRVTFRAGLGKKVRGICRFLLLDTEPDIRLYVTPINIDPEKPALPVSHPVSYGVYLSKMQGPFATLGLAEDDWGLNEGILDEQTFLDQALLIEKEREEMFFNMVDKTRRGLCAVVFDGTDRIQHMFYRYLVDGHPANRGKDTKEFASTIEDLYTRMDGLVGRTMKKVDDKSLLIVMSDHGFKAFNRGVNLNRWLMENGYLAVKQEGDDPDNYLQKVDWSRTKAYLFGLTGIYFNLKGRESQGIVSPGEEAEALKKEIIEKLSGLKDPENGETAINEVFDSAQVYSGPYLRNAPELIIGYNVGYRASWDAAVGKVNTPLFEDNIKAWSGDHCIDPRLVPGVLFCNHSVDDEEPGIIDIAPTVLNVLGVEVPSYMDGKPFILREDQKQNTSAESSTEKESLHADD